jgi:uroporphyrinogen decarboxylase
MTSRERIITALNFQVPDRIPVDFGGHRSSGIHAITYARLKEALGIKTGDIYVYDMIQQLAIVEEPVLDLFHADTIEMGRGFLLDDKEWKEWVLPDGTPCKIPYFMNVEKKGNDWYLLANDGKELGVQKKGCYYFEQTHYPFINVDFENEDFASLADSFRHSMWNSIPSPGGHLGIDSPGIEQLRHGAENLRKKTNRAIIGLFGGNLFELPQFLFNPEKYLTYLALYPEACYRLSEKITEIHLNKLEKWLPAVGPFIDIIMFGDDLGTNAGPMIPPEYYKTYFKPFHKIMWKRVRELADVKIQLHSCGSIEAYLEDMIDAGLDAVNPVQISSCNMDLPHLKQKFGGKITLWGGGCDTQRILQFGTQDEVKKHVKEQIILWKGEGGYVFQQVHNIMADVPVENIITMFETVAKYG